VVDCTAARHRAQLIVWTSGEAELSVGNRSTGAIATTTYEMTASSNSPLAAATITDRLTPPTNAA
jgi:hypothetical protein